jgi:hypothetical protein
MKKKLTALLTAFLVALSIFPMNVAAVGAGSQSTVFTATFTPPDITIDVIVPSKVQTVLNPKELKVEAGGKQSSGQIIFSDPVYIENKSEAPVSVSVSVTGSVNSGSSLVLSEKTTRRLKTKAAFVYFEMLAVDDPENVEWSSGYSKRNHILVLDGVTQEKTDYVTLGAVTQDNRYGAFQLNGDCVEFPTDDPWKDGDGFTANIVFSFKPLRLSD